MRARFTLPGLVYLALALCAVAGVLYATITIYTEAGRDLPDIFSACIGHSAAVLGVFAFVGATDMFFRFEETKERVEERREWQDELRKAREASDARLNEALEQWRSDREYERAQLDGGVARRPGTTAAKARAATAANGQPGRAKSAVAGRLDGAEP